MNIFNSNEIAYLPGNMSSGNWKLELEKTTNSFNFWVVQTLAAWNGIIPIDVILSSKFTVTGCSCHFIQISVTAIMPKSTDIVNAIDHHTLKITENSQLDVQNEWKFAWNWSVFFYLSAQWSFGSTKYRTPCRLDSEQKSLHIRANRWNVIKLKSPISNLRYLFTIATDNIL